MYIYLTVETQNEGKKELKGEIGNSVIIVGDFNASLSIIDRTITQKINKDIDFNTTIKQQDIVDIYRALYTMNA